ncbi:MAG: Dihydropteroate synthase [Promethearchaeota archaeon]|nr:MAG: Dihydropteroate synthase [Candidatus Lokiarchaeota archaeon]
MIYSNLYNILKIGDEFPPIVMGVINLSPESFYKGSVYQNEQEITHAARRMITNGARILDIGARSTAPWSEKILVKEEKKRIINALTILTHSIDENIILSIDTQYREVAEEAFCIMKESNRKIIINDVSCLKTDPSMIEFIITKDIPIILMASRKVPGDLCTMENIRFHLNKTIKLLKKKGYNEQKIIIDPGIGHWIKKKTYNYDLNIIDSLERLRNLQKPILVAISRKSFIGEVLHIKNPQDRLAGTLAATAIAVYNGAHIIRTHDVDKDLFNIISVAKAIRRNE